MKFAFISFFVVNLVMTFTMPNCELHKKNYIYEAKQAKKGTSADV